MDAHKLRTHLSNWLLSQSEFAQWIKVSPGAVNQWLASVRSIPGPVVAFIELFESLPPSLQDRELSKLRKGVVDMNGMYLIEFHGTGGSGGATLTLTDGRAYGFDIGGGIYDGSYQQSSTAGHIDIEVNVKMPAGVQSVIRGISQPFDWNVIAKASFPIDAKQAEILVDTNLGERIKTRFTRMRDLPKAA